MARRIGSLFMIIHDQDFVDFRRADDVDVVSPLKCYVTTYIRETSSTTDKDKTRLIIETVGFRVSRCITDLRKHPLARFLIRHSVLPRAKVAEKY